MNSWQHFTFTTKTNMTIGAGMLCNGTLCKFISFTIRNTFFNGNVFKNSVHFCSLASKSKNSHLKVSIIPALQDNYMYVLIDKNSNVGIAVDPVEPDKIINCLKNENVKLASVLTTHHHADHAGGNKHISEKFKNISIYGGDDRIDCLTNKLYHEEIVTIGDIRIQCLHTPCHTSGHVCYFIKDIANPICFTGDTLFIGGCGRFFEGSAEQMLQSLKILSKLPSNTKLYCGHEYTVSNLKYALTVEPQNKNVLAALHLAEAKLLSSRPTVPSTIGDELLYNPFLRVNERSIQNFTKANDPAKVMKILRELKDNFKI